LVPLIQDDNGKIFGLRSTMMFDEMELNDKISIRIYVVKAAGFALKSITPFENINPIGVA
jgi:hypothetical protein